MEEIKTELNKEEVVDIPMALSQSPIVDLEKAIREPTVITTAMVEEPKKEPIDFFAKLVKPHNKKSRPVVDTDIPRVIEDAKVMYNLCYTQCGIYPGAHAVHNSQINDIDPLNFFVTASKEIFINPVITRHTKAFVDSKEGCLTFYDKPEKIVGRFHKTEIDCQTLNKDEKLSEVIHLKLQGKDSKIWQHEIDHSNGILIY